jgi:hypothetical protein
MSVWVGMCLYVLAGCAAGSFAITKAKSPILPLLVAIVGVPFACALVTEVTYQASRIYEFRFTDQLIYPIVEICLFAGIVAIQFKDNWSWRLRVIVSVVYLPLMFYFLLLMVIIQLVLNGALP